MCEGLVRGGVVSCGVDVTCWNRDVSWLARVLLGANALWMEFAMVAGRVIVVGLLGVRDVSLGDVVLRLGVSVVWRGWLVGAWVVG